MERIKINLPDHFSFSTTIKVRITDINYGGHVGNDSFLSLIHEARLQYLQYHGYSELEFENCSLIMADAAIEFKKELMYGHEVKVSVQASGFDKIGFDLFYKMEVIDGENLTLAAKAKTGMMCFDYTIRKRTEVPVKAIQKLSPL